ncbi:hypothetical protein FRB94_011360 [Tulasnella sp. JGI-2019a]|nr:hypothetical protein FRB93_003296 [Tulasnella sp. JGI-2019a]KAG9009914.1 hypothetical protein FRB94_011360 [Tulasnella sp. JGI-2019a]
MFVNVKLPVQPQTTREKLARIDYLGSFTLVIGVGAFLLAVTLIGSEGLPWIHPLVLGLFTSSGVFITAFITVENFVSKEPIVPLRLLREKTPLAIAVVNLTVFFVSYSLMYNVPVYFIAVRLKSSETAGLHLLPYSVAVALGSGVAGLYMKAFGKFYYYTLMSASVFVISSFLMALWKDSTSSLHLWGDVALSGFGMVSLATTTIVALIASVDREDVAVATGIAFTFRTTGQVLGVSLSGTLLQSQLVKHLRERITGAEAERIIETIRHSTTTIPRLDPPIRQAAIESYALSLRVVFWVQTGVALVTFLACLTIEENPLPDTMAEQAKQDGERRRRRSEAQDASGS